MSVRAFTVAFGVAAALSACGGREQLLGADDPSLPDAAGSMARGGASGSGPLLSAGAGSDAAGAAGFEAGTGGDLANGGAAEENRGGSSNHAGSSNYGGSNHGGSNHGGVGGVGGVGVAGSCANGPGAFATEVLSHAFGGGQNVNQASGFPGVLLGPPVANDPSAVVSLGNGGWVVLGFAANAIVDGPGVDFTVFENPLPSFKELATVAVSDDGELWTEFPCGAAQDASDFGFCAGVNVVLSSPKNGIDPLDPAVSGGDHYDLADIGVTHARFVRITDRADLTGNAGVFDLDAVAIVHGECP